MSANRQRVMGKTIALYHGTFDLLHMGHIRHLQLLESPERTLRCLSAERSGVPARPRRTLLRPTHHRSPALFRSANSTTLVKRRFVDEDFNRLFEVYLREGKDYDPAVDSAASRWLERELPQFDLVVVPDFGNGFISDDMVETLCEHARFLAVNTQINSGNRGFHVINRYRRADLVSLNEPELRLAAHDRANSVDRIAEMLAGRVNARVVAVTMGTAGVRMCERESGEYVQVPALSTKVVDRIRAGDAFLSLAALCVGGGLPADLAAFVGSAAAAIDVQIVCNRSPVTSAGLFRYITTLLKWPTNTSIEAAARPGRRPETLAPRPEWLVPRIRRLVSSWNRRDRRIVLFGAGEVTSCLFKWTNITEANLVAIAEPAATLQGKKIWNLETVAPEAIRELSADTVLVCSNDSSGEIRRALASLEQDGFEVVSLRPTSNSGRKRKTIRAGTSAFVS